MSDQTRPVDLPSHEGLASLYREHKRWLTGMLRKRFGSHDVEDLVQETYIRIAPALERCATLSSPKAMLLRIATNVAVDEARRRKILQGWSQGEALDALGRNDQGAGQDEVVLFKQVILTLSPKLREVFLLSRFGGLSNGAIAERLDLPLKTVEWRMSKALAQCAALIRD